MKGESAFLKRHFEPERPETEIPKSLSEPILKNNKFDKGEGELEFERAGIRVNIEYGKTDEFNKTLNTVARHTKENEKELRAAMELEWKTLERLEIKDQNGKKVFDLSPKLTVVFPLTNEVFRELERSSDVLHEKGSDGEEDYSILLTSNISSPATLVILFHELGHIRSGRFTEKSEKSARYAAFVRTLNKKYLQPEESNDPFLWDKMGEAIIEEERTAWAYALNKLRPLVRSGFLNKEDLIAFVHEINLQSYSDFFKRYSDPNFKDRLMMEFTSFFNTLLDAES